MITVRLPKMGMTMESGEIASWLKTPGDRVEAGEPLLSVTTDKVDLEVEAPSSGLLAQILVQAGETVAVGAPIAILVAEGESYADEKLPATPATIQATPRVRKLAADLNVDLAALAATHPGRAVIEQDVQAQAAATRTAVTSNPTTQHRERLSPTRRAMARHLAESWRDVPHFHQIVEIDAAPLLRAHAATSIPLTSYVVRAVALALELHPHINARLDGDDLLRLDKIHVSVAIGTDDGLYTPVIRDANSKPVRDVAAELEELSAKARTRRLTTEDLDGGTFTVSNLGMYGIDSGTPVINAPQLAMLFVGAIRTAVVWEGDRAVPAKRCTLTFAYDHRAIDGIMGALFTREVRNLLEKDTERL